MAENNDFLKRVTVIVNKGSGLLFKPTQGSSNAFLITAYHVFSQPPKIGERSFQIDWKVKAFHPYESEINLTDCSAECIYISDKSGYDLVVVNISDIAALHLEPPVLDIFDGEFDSSFVAGYPAIKALASDQFKKFTCFERVPNTPSQHKYQVNTLQRLQTEDFNDIESVKGISGGGVVILGGDGKLHLAGVVRSSELFGDFAFTSICDLMCEINNCLDPSETKLQLYAQQCYYECGIDPEQLKIEEIKQAIIETKNNPLVENYDAGEPLDSLKSNQGSADKAFKEIIRKQKELSNYYVLLGITHEEHQQSHSSTSCFKKAIQLDSKNEYIYNEAYMKRSTKQSTTRPNKALYEKTKKGYKSDSITLASEPEDSLNFKKQLSLNKIIQYHYASYQETPNYIKGLPSKDQHELKSFCEDYVHQSYIEYALEARVLLIETYISLDRITQAKNTCEMFLLKDFISKPDRNEQFLFLKLRYLLAIKVNSQATHSDWQAFRQFANQSVDEHLAVSFVTYTLEIVESVYQNENDEGLVGIERLERLYSPLRSVLHTDNSMLDEIGRKVQKSYDEKITSLTRGEADISKADLVKENQNLRQFNSTYKDELNTLKLRIENLENPETETKINIAKEKPNSLWATLLKPLMFLRSNFKP
jgi:hypothetical protein